MSLLSSIKFQVGRVRDAIEKWEKARKLDPLNPNILSNLSLAYLKLDRLNEALECAERCCRINVSNDQYLNKRLHYFTCQKPNWNKSWYRKGAVFMKQKKFIDAANSFQTGLEYNPDDSDLKKMYMEAVTLAEKAPSKSQTSGSFDKRMMGMMMQLQNFSWVRTQFLKQL
jgi:tetratricopeptide (TPR) repeat protein